jgi:hypothetical protein
MGQALATCCIHSPVPTVLPFGVVYTISNHDRLCCFASATKPFAFATTPCSDIAAVRSLEVSRSVTSSAQNAPENAVGSEGRPVCWTHRFGIQGERPRSPGIAYSARASPKPETKRQL